MVHNPISLKNICDKKLKKNTSCHNALDVLIVAHILKMGPLCQKAKEFIWTNKSNDVLKFNWKKLEKENPIFFKKVRYDENQNLDPILIPQWMSQKMRQILRMMTL